MHDSLPLMNVGSNLVLMIDIIEESNDGIMQSCYWDFGDWSNLWREYRQVPKGVSLQVIA